MCCAKAETSLIEPTAEKFQFLMAQKWENLNPPWAAVHAEAPAAECEVGVAIRAVTALGSGWSCIPQVW